MFQNHQLMTFYSLYIYETIIFVKYNMDKFKRHQKQQDSRVYNLRNPNTFPTTFHKTQFYENHIMLNSSRFYNTLPNNIKKNKWETLQDYSEINTYNGTNIYNRSFFFHEDYI